MVWHVRTEAPSSCAVLGCLHPPWPVLGECALRPCLQDEHTLAAFHATLVEMVSPTFELLKISLRYIPTHGISLSICTLKTIFKYSVFIYFCNSRAQVQSTNTMLTVPLVLSLGQVHFLSLFCQLTSLRVMWEDAGTKRGNTQGLQTGRGVFPPSCRLQQCGSKL